MKHFLILIIVLITQLVNAIDLSEQTKIAFEGKNDCNGSLYSNEKYAYYANLAQLKIIDLKTEKETAQIFTSFPITAIKSDNEKLFILTEGNLEVWDLAGQKQYSLLSTYPNVSAPFNFYEQPRGISVTHNKIYIAHGTYGVVVIDRVTEKIENIIPTKSTVRDLVISNNTAILVNDNNTMEGFHGFVLVDLISNQVKKYIAVENVFPESITIVGEALLVGYFSTIWKYNTQDVLNQENPAVLRRFFNFPSGPGTIIGKAHYDSKYMYSCFESVDENGKNPNNKIVVFDRTAIGL